VPGLLQASDYAAAACRADRTGPDRTGPRRGREGGTGGGVSAWACGSLLGEADER